VAGRPSNPPDIIEFTAADRTPVVRLMRDLARERNGWLNLQPDIDVDELPDPGPSVLRVFSTKGPRVPLATWVPGAKRRDGSYEPVSLGLQHPNGPKAIPKLRELGHGPPEGWRLLADHPRRGLVLLVPDDDDPDEALAWVMKAAQLLSQVVLPARWLAGRYVR
jgi:hypothetical protein